MCIRDRYTLECNKQTLGLVVKILYIFLTIVLTITTALDVRFELSIPLLKFQLCTMLVRIRDRFPGLQEVGFGR